MAATKRLQTALLGVSYALLFLIGVGLIVVGTVVHDPTSPPALLLIGLGGVAVIAAVAGLPIAVSLLRRAGSQDRLQGMEQVLAAVHERQLLSEVAKRINARQHDRDMLREAIEEDIAIGDLDSAMLLATELAQSFGCKHESEEFRERIVSARASQYQERVKNAIDRFEQLLAGQHWESATAEAAKLQRLFPESPRISELGNRVQQAWNQHKRELERKFLEAAQRDDVELATGLLSELDKYLTEGEAAPLLEVARGVFRKKKENLGVQFKMAVQDRDWIMAAHVGEHIIREFPNTRMAEEIRGMIDPLRERASKQSAASRQY